jgi:hypothetical protein
MAFADLNSVSRTISFRCLMIAARRVWYLLAIHFVSRGIEFHHQLSMSSIKFQHDEEGIEFLTIHHETHHMAFADLNSVSRTISTVRPISFRCLLIAAVQILMYFCGILGLGFQAISNQELMQINTYLSKKEDIVALRFRVWYLLAIHFVSRGIEFHHQLSSKLNFNLALSMAFAV